MGDRAMRAGGLHYRVKKGACAVLSACAAALLTACAASSNYAGIPLTAGAAEPEVQSLARRARGGDKHAQLELGIRYEEGRGLPLDLGRAVALFRRAGSPGPRVGWTYSPPVGAASEGRVVQLDRGHGAPGLPAAKERLARLRERQKTMQR